MVSRPVERAEPLARRIGEAVRSARTAGGLSTRELARRIGTSQPFVSNIENGRLVPGVRTIGLLATALGVDEHDLLPGSDRADRASLTARSGTDPASRLLLGAQDRVIAVHHVDLLAGEREPRPHVHDGEDLVVVLRGRLEVLRESTGPVLLEEGGALRVEGAVPHRLAALDGPASALVTVAAGPGVAAGAHA